jgi:hypothetical protein
MNKENYLDLLILKKDETILSIIKEMRALSNLLYMKIEDRDKAMSYQRFKYQNTEVELDYFLYQMECMIDVEFDYMKQKIEKKKAETEKSNSRVAGNRYDSTSNHDRKNIRKR